MKHKNRHLRKERTTLADWRQYVKNLDRADRAKDKLYRTNLNAYRERCKELAASRSYYLASFAAPNRNCVKWQKQVQVLTGERLVQYIDGLIGSRVVVIGTAFKARSGAVEGR